MAIFPAGVPVSEPPTDGKLSLQQWDYPNVWAPLQHSLVLFLHKIDKGLSFEIAIKFLKSVFKGFKDYHTFFEKYNCETMGHSGKGGEYEPQVGFGWTNGVILDFMDIFSDKLLAEALENSEKLELVVIDK